ncbi:unnamed protein product [Camellia sinensis]
MLYCFGIEEIKCFSDLEAIEVGADSHFPPLLNQSYFCSLLESWRQCCILSPGPRILGGGTVTIAQRIQNGFRKILKKRCRFLCKKGRKYYKKRPKLMKLVEEFYRAYRALAERYDHTTGGLRHMAEAFPNQVPFVLSDDSPSGSSAHERERHTPKMPHRCEHCLEKISKLESELSCAQEEIRCLNSVVLIETAKLKSAEEKCVLLETSNQSLRLEAENLVKKIAMKDQQLSEKHEDLNSYSRGITIQFRKEEESRDFHCAFDQWKNEVVVQGSCEPNGTLSASKSKFDDKIESSSAKMYFHYYGQLLHQQNMLQDYVRTVAGAKHVYAVEASEMVEYARKLIAGNPLLAQRITVVKGKVEEVELPEKVDILISEPMGTLLVNERMLETYVIARDRFLVPNGKMFPTIGRIHMAPFSDEYLYVEIANKALFWQQRSYYEVDLTPLYGFAFQGYFSQPVVDAFDPSLLVAPAISHTINFTSIKEEELYEIDVPLKFKAPAGTRIHGLACWFDVLFDGSTVQRWLSTAPGAATTHWYQLRCVLSQPLYVMPGQEITGQLHMIAHNAQSYSINLTMTRIDIQIQSQEEEAFELMHQPSQNVDIEYIE